MTGRIQWYGTVWFTTSLIAILLVLGASVVDPLLLQVYPWLPSYLLILLTICVIVHWFSRLRKPIPSYLARELDREKQYESRKSNAQLIRISGTLLGYILTSSLIIAQFQSGIQFTVLPIPALIVAIGVFLLGTILIIEVPARYFIWRTVSAVKYNPLIPKRPEEQGSKRQEETRGDSNPP